MNCDGVFDILTRGPFPSGQPTDAAVEAHLGECPECRRLATALRPAVALFQESLEAEAGYDLPGYWGEIDDVPERRGGSLAATVRASWRRATRRAGGRLAAGGWPLAAAALAGVALAVTLRDRGEPGAERAVRPPVEAAAVAALEQVAQPLAECSRQLLARLPRPSAEARLALAEDQCCSGCHHAGSALASAASLAVVELAQTCRHCHH